MGLVVPALKTALLERIPAHSSHPLTLQHLRMDAVKVPSPMGFFVERLEYLLHIRIEACCQVVQLLRILHEIVELRGISRTSDEFPRTTSDHHKRGNGALACVLAIHRVVPFWAKDATEVRNERVPVQRETLIEGTIHQIDKCR